MSINAPLLEQTLQYIEEHPSEWYQRWWMRLSFDHEQNVCGAAYCFAGHATVLHGAKIQIEEDWDREEEPLVRAVPLPGEDIIGEFWNAGDDDLPSIGYYARQILGLNECQSNALFAPENTLDDLRRIVAELCGQAGQCEATPAKLRGES